MIQPAQTSLLHDVTMLSYVLHIGGGTIALVSGMIAGFSAKGGRLHRAAGNVFFASMLVMALFAAYLAVVRPNQLVNVFIATFAFYLVATGWMTARHQPGTVGAGERIATAVAFILWAPFLLLTSQLAMGLPPLFKSAVPFEGPVLVAIYTFTGVLGIAALSDAKLVPRGGISGAPRIARHLWRMCAGLTLAVGSAFTNGLARFLPGPYHVPLAFHAPKLVPLGLLVFWIIRVRFTGWRKQSAVAPSV